MAILDNTFFRKRSTGTKTQKTTRTREKPFTSNFYIDEYAKLHNDNLNLPTNTPLTDEQINSLKQSTDINELIKDEGVEGASKLISNKHVVDNENFKEVIKNKFPTDKNPVKRHKIKYVRGENGVIRLNIEDLGKTEKENWKNNIDNLGPGTYTKDDRHYNFKYGIVDNSDGSLVDNEDPVYFSFDIIVNQPKSPLLNGEIVSFINQFGGSITEIESRKKILSQFRKEFKKYFKTSGVVNEKIGDDVIPVLNSGDNSKRHYLVKIAGLDKLVEKNTPGKHDPFTKYLGESTPDSITLTFREDTTLNTGTLNSLYKILYWDKFGGKSQIPENLLRFDCQIVVTEMRKFSKWKKTSTSEKKVIEEEKLSNSLRSSDFIEYEARTSRYFYNLYECQLWMDKMTHGDSIDIGKNPEVGSDWSLSMTYKYSDLSFQRFDDKSQEWYNFNYGLTAGNGLYEKNSSTILDKNLEKNIKLDKLYELTYGPSSDSKKFVTMFDKNYTPHTSDPVGDYGTTIDTLISPVGGKGQGQSNIYKRRFVKALDPAGFIKRRGTVVKAIAIGELQRRIATLTPILTRALNRIRETIGLKRPNVYRRYMDSARFVETIDFPRNTYVGDDLIKSNKRKVEGVDRRQTYGFNDRSRAIEKIPNGIRKPNVPIYAANIGDAIFKLVSGVRPPDNIY